VDIRALRDGDDRSRFRSGDADLDRFFIKYAGQNQFRHHIGTTYIAVQDNRILGFVTVSPGHMESEELSAALGKRLPKYPLPILRLARLAVDQTCRGRGLGKELLAAVFDLALRMASDYGCVGILVDAKPGAVDFYGKFGFSARNAVSGGMHVAPRPTSMFLSVARLRQALK
jgi:GNAT superfamily N-acetyltransferase